MCPAETFSIKTKWKKSDKLLNNLSEHEKFQGSGENISRDLFLPNQHELLPMLGLNPESRNS